MMNDSACGSYIFINQTSRSITNQAEFCLSLPLTESKPGGFGIDGPIISYSEPDESSIPC